MHPGQATITMHYSVLAFSAPALSYRERTMMGVFRCLLSRVRGVRHLLAIARDFVGVRNLLSVRALFFGDGMFRDPSVP